MLGVLMDAGASFIGGILGIGFRKYLSDRYIQSILLVLNLTVLVVGIEGAIKIDNMAILLVSVCLGAIIGEFLDIDGKFNSLGEALQGWIKISDENFKEGFLSATLVQCVGALSILAPMELVLKGDSSLMVLKAILDFTTTLIFGSIYGVGVVFSSVFVLLYEGIIVFLSGFLKLVLTDQVINQISAVGSLLIVVLAFDLLDLKKSKVANYLPSILIPIILSFIIK